MDKLRQFIFEEVFGGPKAELTWNYWMRRPRNNRVTGVGDEIEDDRARQFQGSAESFLGRVQDLEHQVRNASSIEALENIMSRSNVDAYDVVRDETRFDDAVADENVVEARDEILSGLERWADDVVSYAEKDGYDYGLLDRLITMS